MKRRKPRVPVVVERVPDVQLTMRKMQELVALKERSYLLLVLQQTVREFMARNGQPPMRTINDDHGRRYVSTAVCDELTTDLFELSKATAAKRNALQEELSPGTTHQGRKLLSSGLDFERADEAAGDGRSTRPA